MSPNALGDLGEGIEKEATRVIDITQDMDPLVVSKMNATTDPVHWYIVENYELPGVDLKGEKEEEEAYVFIRLTGEDVSQPRLLQVQLESPNDRVFPHDLTIPTLPVGTDGWRQEYIGTVPYFPIKREDRRGKRIITIARDPKITAARMREILKKDIEGPRDPGPVAKVKGTVIQVVSMEELLGIVPLVPENAKFFRDKWGYVASSVKEQSSDPKKKDLLTADGKFVVKTTENSMRNDYYWHAKPYKGGSGQKTGVNLEGPHLDQGDPAFQQQLLDSFQTTGWRRGSLENEDGVSVQGNNMESYMEETFHFHVLGMNPVRGTERQDRGESELLRQPTPSPLSSLRTPIVRETPRNLLKEFEATPEQTTTQSRQGREERRRLILTQLSKEGREQRSRERRTKSHSPYSRAHRSGGYYGPYPRDNEEGEDDWELSPHGGIGGQNDGNTSFSEEEDVPDKQRKDIIPQFDGFEEESDDIIENNPDFGDKLEEACGVLRDENPTHDIYLRLGRKVMVTDPESGNGPFIGREWREVPGYTSQFLRQLAGWEEYRLVDNLSQVRQEGLLLEQLRNESREGYKLEIMIGFLRKRIKEEKSRCEEIKGRANQKIDEQQQRMEELQLYITELEEERKEMKTQLSGATDGPKRLTPNNRSILPGTCASMFSPPFLNPQQSASIRNTGGIMGRDRFTCQDATCLQGNFSIFETKGELTRHNQEKHTSDLKCRQKGCPQKDYTFTKASELSRHMNQEHFMYTSVGNLDTPGRGGNGAGGLVWDAQTGRVLATQDKGRMKVRCSQTEAIWGKHDLAAEKHVSWGKISPAEILHLVQDIRGFYLDGNGRLLSKDPKNHLKEYAKTSLATTKHKFHSTGNGTSQQKRTTGWLRMNLDMARRECVPSVIVAQILHQNLGNEEVEKMNIALDGQEETYARDDDTVANYIPLETWLRFFLELFMHRASFSKQLTEILGRKMSSEEQRDGNFSTFAIKLGQDLAALMRQAGEQDLAMRQSHM